MERFSRNTRKRQIGTLLFGVLVFQFFVLALIFFGNNVVDTNVYDVVEDDDEIVLEAEGILGNLTRTDYPFVITNDTATPLFTALHNLSVSQMRVAYLDEGNNWQLVPFQLDEMGYFNTYKYEIAYQGDASLAIFGLANLNDVDLVLWGRQDVEHRYAGRDLNDTSASAYKEPTLYEAENAIWWQRTYEQHIGNPPMTPPPTPPVQDPREVPGGEREQLPRRVDWDDELCFYAANGKKASIYQWWNYNEYPNRFRVKINDPVDGGQAWMYVYFTNDTKPLDTDNYYIPPGGTDYVSWDKNNLKITGQTYETTINGSNPDLDSSLKIKWPGLAQNELYATRNKGYMSIWFHIFYDAGSGVTIDETANTEVWREGLWDEGYYDEQYVGIGYDISMDFGWNDGGGDWSGHRTNADVEAEGIPSSLTHTIVDAGQELFGNQVAAPDADCDYDVAEIAPYVRGIIDVAGASNEAAIDGPVRVILDRFIVQVIKLTMASPVEYEELWQISSKRSKYYASMTHEDPYAMDLNDLTGGLGTMQLDIHPHYAFQFTERYSDFVRSDPGAYILAGQAPNGEPGIIPNFPQATFPGGYPNGMVLNPDGNGGNDDMTSGGNPTAGNYADTSRIPSGSPFRGGTNPLPDWKYISTSSGGAWTYIPYAEWWAFFTGTDYSIGGQYASTVWDLASYWKDTSGAGGYSEWGLTGNDADTNGGTDFYEMRTVFGNFTYWECLREYARMKYQLNDQLVITQEIHPGGPVFENQWIEINGVPQTGNAWTTDGDVVDIFVDVESNYGVGLFVTDVSNFSSVAASVIQTDAVLFIYRIRFTVGGHGNPDRVPSSPGYGILINITSAQPGWINEEMYLDNTNPYWSPDDLLASQVTGSVEAKLNWTGDKDLGQINQYEIYRNGTKVDTIPGPDTEWFDANVLYNTTYEYYVRAFDMVGLYADSTPDSIFIDAEFQPAEPDTLGWAFNNTVSIDWSSNPGDVPPIDNYRIEYAFRNYNPGNHPDYPDAGDYIDTGGWRSTPYTFDPTSFASPKNGTYYIKVVSYDSAGGGTYLRSAPVYSIYDTERPFSGTIQDIPDDYKPLVAEVHVHWSGEFDAFSGIDKFELYRKVGAGSFVLINTFASDEYDYYDYDINDEDDLYYQVKVYDKAGNWRNTPTEYCHYDDINVGATPNLKISTIRVDEDVVGRGATNTFTARVNVTNIGGLQGTVNKVVLEFDKDSTNVTVKFNNIEWNGAQAVDPSETYEFVFIGVYADADTPQGTITVDANMYGVSPNDLDGAPPSEVDTIYLRDFSIITVNSISADDPMDSPSTNNVVNVTVTNDMITAINITTYYVEILTLTEGVDYWVTDAPGNPSTSPTGWQLAGLGTKDLAFFIELDTGIAGPYTIRYILYGYELLSGGTIHNNDTVAITITGVVANNPPTLSEFFVVPDPLQYEQTLNLGVRAADPDTVVTVWAEVRNPGGSLLQNVSLSLTVGDNLNGVYNGTWDSTGQGLANNYYVVFGARDGHATDPLNGYSANQFFDIEDITAPRIDSISYNDPVTYGTGTLSVSCLVTDNYQLRAASPVEIQIRDPVDGVLVAWTAMNDIGGGTYTYAWGVGTNNPDPNYRFQIRATDDATPANVNTTSNQLFDIDDSVDPQIPVISDDGPLEIGLETLFVQCNATDNDELRAVNPVEIQFFDTGGAPLTGWLAMSPYGGTGFSYDWNSGANPPANNYRYQIQATDYSSNTFNSGNNFFNIEDSTDPSIVGISDDGPVEYGVDTLFVVCNVTDNYQLRVANPVEIRFFDPLGTPVTGWLTMSPYGGTGYSYDWNSGANPPDASNYRYQIRATDDAPVPNVGQTGNQLFLIQDTTDPSITSIGDNGPVEYSTGSLFVDCNVTDLYLLRPANPVEIRFFDPTGTPVTGWLAMSPFGGTGYSYSWNPGVNPPDTNYRYQIQATDNAPVPNVANSGDNLFDIEDNVIPVIVSAGTNPSTLTQGAQSSAVEVYATVTDNYQLRLANAVGAMIYNPGGTLIDFMWLGPQGSDYYNVTWDASSYPQANNYYIWFNATDNQTNPAAQVQFFFDIISQNPPVINNPGVTPTPLELTTSLMIIANITDSDGFITGVVGRVFYPNGTWIEDVNMPLWGGTGYMGQWDSSVVPLIGIGNNFYVIINATDNDTLSSQSAAQMFDIIITPPNILTPDFAPDPLNYGGVLTINATVTDTDGIGTVWAEIYYANGTLINGSVSMPLKGGSVYEGNWYALTTPIGVNYYIDIHATDTNAYENSTLGQYTLEFDIQDTQAPVIQNINYATPIEWSTGNLFVTCNVTDNVAVANVQIQIYDPSSAIILPWAAMSYYGGSGNSYNWLDVGEDIGVNYYFRIRAMDAVPNTQTSVNQFFNIEDSVNPVVENITNNDPVEWSTGTLTVSADVADNYGLTNIEIRIYDPIGGILLPWTAMVYSGTGNQYDYNWAVVGNDPDVNYYFIVRGTDASSNTNTSANQLFDITDTVIPNIVGIGYNDPVEWTSGTLSITCTVTDNYQLRTTDPVEIQIRDPLDAVLQGWTAMTSGGGGTYTYAWGVGANDIDVGYRFQIRATDNSSGTNTTGNQLFDITDTVFPAIPTIGDNGPIEYSTGTLTVTCNATDNYGINTVEIQIRDPIDGILQGWIAMTPFGGTGFKYDWSPGANPPDVNYRYQIRATDDSSNPTTSANQLFDIQDNVIPLIKNFADNNSVEYGIGTLFVQVNASDNYQLRAVNPVQIQFYDTLGAPITAWLAMTPFGGTGFSYNWNSGANPPDVNYRYQIRATDTSTNTNQTGDNLFDIVDNADPVIADITDDGPVEYSTGTLNVDCNVTDNYQLEAVNPVQIRFFNTVGAPITGWLVMSAGAGDAYSYAWSPGANIPDTGYRYQIQATDDQANTANSGDQLFDIQDNVDPVIAGEGLNPNPVPRSVIVEFFATVTDNYLLAAANPVGVIIQDNTSTTIGWMYLVDQGGNYYNNSWNPGAILLGNGYTVIFNATDDQGNSATSPVVFNIVPVIPPQIANPGVNPLSLELNDLLTITANVTQGTNPIQSIKGQVYYPNNTWIEDVNMPLWGGTGYMGQWDSSVIQYSEIGNNFYVVINATDDQASSSYSAQQLFDIFVVPPNIINPVVDPDPLEYAGILTINATVTDTDGIQSVTAYIYAANGTQMGTENMPFIGSDVYEGTWDSLNTPLGVNFYVIINVTDNNGYLNSTQGQYTIQFDIEDNTNPSIGSINHNTPVEWSTGALNVTCQVTDNYPYTGLTVDIRIFDPSSGLIVDWTSMTGTGGPNYKYDWLVVGNDIGAGYYYIIRAIDSSTNTDTTANQLFNIEDSVDPVLENITDDGPVEWSTGSLTVSADAADNYGVNAVQIQVRDPLDAVLLAWTNMTYSGSGNQYDYIWAVGANDIDVNYRYQVRVIDDSSNTVTSVNQLFDIVDSVDPVVGGVGYNDPVPYGTGTLTVTCNASDNYGLSAIEIEIRDPSNGLLLAWTGMTPIGGTGYQYDWAVGANIPAVAYYFRLRATDASSNTDQTLNQLFEIQDQVNPTVENISYNNPVEWSSGTLAVSVDAIDNYGLSDVEIRIYNPLGSTILAWTSMTNVSNTYTYNYPVVGNTPDVDYYFAIRATDLVTRTTTTANQLFNITDTVDPVIAGPGNFPNPIPQGTLNVEIFASVTDNYLLRAVNPVGVNIYNPGGSPIGWMWLVDQGGNYFNNTWDASTFGVANNYYIWFNATDDQGNVDTVQVFINIVAGNPPVILNPNVAPDPLEKDDLLMITANVTDDTAVQTVIGRVFYPNNTWIEDVNMPLWGGDGYMGQWDSSVVPLSGIGNNFYVIINATDNVGDSSWTAQQPFDVIITPPTIASPVVVPSSLEYGANITINATITDDGTVVSARAYIYWDNGTEITNIPLFDQGSDIWENEWNATTYPVAVNYFVNITATDNKGYVQTTGRLGALEFDIVDTTDPQITGIVDDGPAELGTGQLAISCDVTDNYQLLSVEIRVYDNVSTPLMAWTPMVNTAGDTYNYTWSVGANPIAINYIYRIRATDTSTNVLTTGDQLFDIVDTTGPSTADQTVNPTAVIIGENFTIYVNITDLSGVNSAFASVRYLSNDTLVVTNTTMIRASPVLQPNEYSVGVNTTGWAPALYYVEIWTDDSYGNPTLDNFGQTLTVSVSDTTAIVVDDFIWVKPQGFIDGVSPDNISAILRIHNTGGAINITSIELDFILFNSSFTNLRLNLTAGQLDALVLDAGTPVDIMIYYDIDAGASTSIDTIGANPNYIRVVILGKENVSQAPLSISAAITAGTPDIDIYELPVITSVDMSVTDGALLNGGNNDVSIYIYGSYEGITSLYFASIDLTAWGIPGYTYENMGWDSGNSRYEVNVLNIPDGSYDGAQIVGVLNITLPAPSGVKSVSQAYSKTFSVDSTPPVINNANQSHTQIDLILVSEITIDVNITDIGSGVSALSIVIADNPYPLTQTANPDIWRIVARLSDLDEKIYGDKEITFGQITGQDVAGNTVLNQSSDFGITTITFYDISPPVVDWTNIEIDGKVGGTLKFKAGKYITIKIKITDLGSEVMWVKLYYKIVGGSITPSGPEAGFTEMELILAGDKYFGVLSAPNQVGFTAEQQLIIYLEAMDYSGLTATTTANKITMTFYTETPLVSYIVLGFAVACILGAAIFRFGFYRKKAKIIDLDAKLIKAKKK
jgi:hypothetical protein